MMTLSGIVHLLPPPSAPFKTVDEALAQRILDDQTCLFVVWTASGRNPRQELIDVCSRMCLPREKGPSHGT